MILAHYLDFDDILFIFAALIKSKEKNLTN